MAHPAEGHKESLFQDARHSEHSELDETRCQGVKGPQQTRPVSPAAVPSGGVKQPCVFVHLLVEKEREGKEGRRGAGGGTQTPLD